MNSRTKMGIGLCLMVLSCIFIASAFIMKQQTIGIEPDHAEEFANKFGTTVADAEANLARFMKQDEAEVNAIYQRRSAEKTRKEQQIQKFEEAKEKKFYRLLGIAAVAFISGIIMLSGTKPDKPSAEPTKVSVEKT